MEYNKKVRSKWENREQYDNYKKTNMTEDDLLEFYEWDNDNDINDLFKNIKIDDEV